METSKLLKAIDLLLIEMDKYAGGFKDQQSVDDVRRVVLLLKEEVLNRPEAMNERVLRAMHDVGMASYKDFENTSLEESINSVTKILYFELPIYKDLKPLRGEFGNGYPI